MSQTKLIVFFLVFLAGGLYGGYSVDFIQNDKALAMTFRWFTVPSIIIGLYYGYRSTFGYNKETARWRNVIGLVTLTLILGIMSLKFFQGYLVFFNCNLGTQKQIVLKGQVTKLDYPKTKKPFNNYAIIIETDSNESITLDVPTNEYSVGQIFEKELTLGSLGLLYSRQ
jgi:hypothetical protein